MGFLDEHRKLIEQGASHNSGSQVNKKRRDDEKKRVASLSDEQRKTEHESAMLADYKTKYNYAKQRAKVSNFIGSGSSSWFKDYVQARKEKGEAKDGLMQMNAYLNNEKAKKIAEQKRNKYKNYTDEELTDYANLSKFMSKSVNNKIKELVSNGIITQAESSSLMNGIVSNTETFDQLNKRLDDLYIGGKKHLRNFNSKDWKAEAEDLDNELKTRKNEKLSKKYNALNEDAIKLLDQYNEGINERGHLGFENGVVTFTNLGSNANNQKVSDAYNKLVAMGIDGDSIRELADYRNSLSNEEKANEAFEKGFKRGEQNPGKTFFEGVGYNAASTAQTITSILGSFASGRDYDPKSNEIYQYKKGASEGAVSSFDNGILSRNTKAFLYQTGQSGVESLSAMMFGGLGGALLGTNAFAETLNNNIEDGKNIGDAFGGAVCAGIAEGLFESLSLGKLRALQKSGKTGVKALLEAMAKEGFVNFSEEANTEISNIITDYLFNKEKSDYVKKYEDYLIQFDGDTSQASKAVATDFAKQVGEAGLGGLLMGTVFGAVGVTSNTGVYNAQASTIGSKLLKNGQAENVVEKGKASEDATIQKLADKAYNKMVSDQEKSTKKAEEKKSADTKANTDEQAQISNEEVVEETANNSAESGAENTKVSSDEGKTKESESSAPIRYKRSTKKAVGKAAIATVQHSSETLRKELDKYGINDSAKRIAELSYQNSMLSGSKVSEEEFANDYNYFYEAGKSGVKDGSELLNKETKLSETAIKSAVQNGRYSEEQKRTKKANKQIRLTGEIQLIENNPHVTTEFGDVIPLQTASAYGVSKDAVSAYSHANTYNTLSPAISSAILDAYTNDGIDISSNINTAVGSVFVTNSLNEFLESEGAKSLFKVLDEESVKNFYNTVSKDKDAKRSNYKAKERIWKKADGKVTVSDSISKNKKDSKSFKAKQAYYEMVAKKFGTDIEIVSADDINGANASIFSNKGLIKVNANASPNVVMHELGHRLAVTDAASYAILQDELIKFYKDRGVQGEKTLLGHIADTLVTYADEVGSWDYNYIMEEFTNEALVGLFESEKGASELLDFIANDDDLTKAERKTILEKLGEALEWLKETLLDLIVGDSFKSSPVAKQIAMYAERDADRADELRVKVMNALASIDGTAPIVSTEEASQTEMQEGDIIEIGEEDDLNFSKEFKTIDDEYNKLAENADKNKSKLNKLVDNAALIWGAYSDNGHPVKWYRGTKNFGSTVFNSKFIFMTDELSVASTYSGKGSIDNVNASKRIDLNKMNPKQLANFMTENNNDKLTFKPKYGYRNSYTGEVEDGIEVNGQFYNMQSAIKWASSFINNPGNYSLFAKAENLLVIDNAKNNRYIPIPADLNENNIYSKYGTTDEIAEIAKSRGYDGVLFKGIEDNGLYGDFENLKPSNVLVVFNNSQVKSADTITYDDNGNVISLSKRFSNSEDIRYSKPFDDSTSKDIDNEYLEAVKLKDYNKLNSMVKNAAQIAGYPHEAYHGTSRADRVGYVFLPERSTSGPMAFFTSSEEIASNYARDKEDTSLAYDDEYLDYYTQFRVNFKGQNLSVVDLWNKLTLAERNVIKQRANHVTFDDDYENVIYDENQKYGLGDLDPYAINMNKGNYIKALVQSWLENGNLYNEEAKFKDVLKLSGLNYDVEYKDPNYKEPKVYHAFLGINNPFNTETDYNSNFVQELTDWYEQQEEGLYERESNNADMWDKNNQDLDSWIEKAERDIEFGNTHAWTVIPDFVTDFLKSKGYDGIQDLGGKNGGASHTVWIPFSSKQVKSADPITYDNNGNVIPLSKRFSNSEDIRYSKSYNDLFEETNDGRVKVKDLDALTDADWNKITKAVNKLGYGLENVTQAKTAFSRFVSTKGFLKDQSDAIKKAFDFNKSNIQSNFINPSRMKSAKKHFGITSNFAEAGYILQDGKMLDFSNKKDGAMPGTRNIDHRGIGFVFDADELDFNGDNSIYMYAFINEGNIRLINGSGFTLGEIEPTNEQYSRLNKFIENQLDNHGFVYLDIESKDGHSISNREYRGGYTASKIINDIKSFYKNGELPYQSNLQQFRYSKPYSDADIVAEERKSLTEEILNVEPDDASLVMSVGDFKERLSDIDLKLSKVKSKLILESSKIKTVASKIARDNSSSVNRTELAAQLEKAYSAMIKGDNSTADKLFDEAVRMVTESSTVYNPVDDYDKTIINDIKQWEIAVDEGSKPEILHVFDTYGAFYKASFGKLKIRSNGTSIDTVYKHFLDAYPGKFEEVNTTGEMVLELLNFVREHGVGSEANADFDIESGKEFIKAQMKVDITRVSAVRTSDVLNAMSSLDAELNKVKNDFASFVAEANKQIAMTDKQNTELYGEAVDEYKKHVDEMRKKYEGLRNDLLLRQQNKEVTATKQSYRNAIGRKVKSLNSRLTRPSANNGYIPAEFYSTVRQAVKPFLSDTSVFNSKQLTSLNKAYNMLSKTEMENESIGWNQDIADSISKLNEKIDGKRLSQLELEDLQEILQVLNNIDFIVKDGEQIEIDNRKAEYSKIGSNLIDELEKHKPAKISRFADKKTYQSYLKVKNMMGVNNMTPAYFFKSVGGVLQSAYQGIRNGQMKYVNNIAGAKEYLNKTLEEHNGKGRKKGKLRNDEVFTITTERGDKLQFTYGQAMTIFATWKREMASDQEAEHLERGGIVFEDDFVRDSKNRPTALKDNSAKPLSFTDLMNIASHLDENQKKYVDKMVKYLSSDMSALGNEVSMQLYGINSFRETYYFPFHSSGYYLHKGFAEGGDARLKAMGFTKATVKHANNPLLVADFTEIWTEHCERMSAYNAFVIPMEHFTKIWNYKEERNGSNVSVRQMIDKSYGKEYTAYINNLMNDLNGNVMKDSRDDVFGALLSKFKKNSVMLNASVAIQQPSAILRAFALVNPKYFVKITNPLKSYEEGQKYSSAMALKAIGGFDVGTSRGIPNWIAENFHDKTTSEKIDDIGGKAPELMDAITWGHIWEAVKKETKAKTGLKGMELLAEAGKRMDEVCDYTQVYDTTFTRSSNMRSPTTYMKVATAFMGEPTVTINMLADALRQGKNGNIKFAIGAVSACAAQIIFNSMLKSLVSAGRNDDDDKTYTEKYLKELISNAFDDANPMGMIPFANSLLSLLEGFDINRSDMEVLTYMWDQTVNTFKDSRDLKEAWGELETGEKVKGVTKEVSNIINAVAALFGIPTKNLVRDGLALYNTAKQASSPIKNSKENILQAIKEGVLPASRSVSNKLGIDVPLFQEKSKDTRMYEAWLLDDTEAFEYLAGDKDINVINNKIKSRIADDYVNGTYTKEQALVLMNKLEVKNAEDYLLGSIDAGYKEAGSAPKKMIYVINNYGTSSYEYTVAKSNYKNEKSILGSVKNAMESIFAGDDDYELSKDDAVKVLTVLGDKYPTDTVREFTDPNYEAPSNQERLYNSWVQGGYSTTSAEYEKAGSTYKNGSYRRTALRNQIEVEYKAGRISFSEAYSMLVSRLGYTSNWANKSIANWGNTSSTTEEAETTGKWDNVF